MLPVRSLLRRWITGSGKAQQCRQLSTSLESIGNGFQQTVGNTDLIYLSHASKVANANIFGKAEYQNPGGSVKDRAALNMIMDAEVRGVLKRGEPGIVVEGTAGNTGIGLALVAVSHGYECIICVADTISQEKKDVLKWAGATLIEVPAVPYKNPGNYVHVARRLADELNKKGMTAFYANQWDNLANRQAHVTTTGPEVVNDLKKFGVKLDAFSCAMGTGGTLCGMSEFLKAADSSVKIALTDPCGAAMFRFYTEGELKSQGNSISEGIGQGRITGNMEGFRPDMCFEIDDVSMMNTLYDMQTYDGLCLGGSAGINVAGAIEVAKELGPGSTVVTMLCDLGSRYASKLYNPSFLRSKSLPVAPWIDESHKSPIYDIVTECTQLAREHTD